MWGKSGWLRRGHCLYYVRQWGNLSSVPEDTKHLLTAKQWFKGPGSLPVKCIPLLLVHKTSSVELGGWERDGHSRRMVLHSPGLQWCAHMLLAGIPSLNIPGHQENWEMRSDCVISHRRGHFAQPPARLCGDALTLLQGFLGVLWEVGVCRRWRYWEGGRRAHFWVYGKIFNLTREQD